MSSETCPPNDQDEVESPGGLPVEQTETSWEHLYSQATKDWIKQHEYCQDKTRRSQISEFIASLDDDWGVERVVCKIPVRTVYHGATACWEIDDALYEIPRAGSFNVPIIVLSSGCLDDEFRLPGLFPAECDFIRGHSLDEESNLRPCGVDESLVVATLATLLCQRGVRLNQDTVFFLHGGWVPVGDHVIEAPPFARIWLAEAVEDHGWDATANYLDVTQTNLFRQRRGPGRPKNEEIDKWMRDEFRAVKNASQVAREAAGRFGITPEAARKRIDRADWYQKTPRPSSPHKTTKDETTPSKPIVSQQEDLLDAVERVLRRGDATVVALANAVNSEPKLLGRLLIEHKDRFRYLPGDLWGLYE